MTPLTPGTLLGGRVTYAQPQAGYRTGIEPVLLAACVAARPGQHVVEAGTGAGAALLCLAERVRGVRGTGIESDPEMAEVARGNLAANGRGDVGVVTCDVLAWRPDAPCHHAMANPPWHSDRGTPSPDRGRRAAKLAGDGLLAAWALALTTALVRRGTLTFLLPAALLAEGVAALAAAECGEVAVQPLWPRCGTPARLVIVRGVRHGRGASRLLPGLTLHGPNGEFTAEAEAVLRHGAPLAV